MKFASLKQRVGVAFIFGPPILVFSLLGEYFFLAVLDAIIFFSMREFYRLTQRKGAFPATTLAIAFGLGLSWNFYFRKATSVGADSTTGILAVFIIAVLLWELFRKKPLPIFNAAVTVLGVFYVPFLLSYLILVRELPITVGVSYLEGGKWVFSIFIIVWAADTAAYFWGARFGRHKLCVRISPGKTVEGAIAGFLTAIIFALLARLILIRSLGTFDCIIIGLIIGTFGQLSDLVESLIKRDAGVKDASAILPGHGGILDRFDTLILISPLIYFYLRYLVF